MMLLKRQKSYDPVQRLLHWVLALTILGLMLTGLWADEQNPGGGRTAIWDLHMQLGSVFVIALGARILWGFFGPHHARFSSLVMMKDWRKIIRTRQVPSVDGEFGHHPQAAFGYLGFYALAITMAISGLLLSAIIHAFGPFASQLSDRFENEAAIYWVHEHAWWLIAAFIAGHIFAIIFHEIKDGIPVAQSMISGYQYRSQKED